MSKVWGYGITYHRDGNHVELHLTPLWVLIAEAALDNRPTVWLAGRFVWSYRLFSKVVFWLDTKREVQVQIPATAEILSKIAPDDEWLWGDDDEPDVAGDGAGG